MPATVLEKFPVPMGEILCSVKKDSLFRFDRELARNVLEWRRELTSWSAETAGKAANSLLFSLFSGNSAPTRRRAHARSPRGQ
jgi:hypothetical protein